ncbi:hypothetical protein L1987_30050 [Smallanthus sonchifolius]|uniref:Uncharacterized protein n=1 Tax=Smallanthus sonchifolius TaxID=185202 RepID=A0ACB9I2D6_9ASTR|nr:hypothetical protein L1987_30050 [Smallanthus sonchifolius]
MGGIREQYDDDTNYDSDDNVSTPEDQGLKSGEIFNVCDKSNLKGQLYVMEEMFKVHDNEKKRLGKFLLETRRIFPESIVR